ncbi:T9SS type A sorting domain-containing protein, partial [bacterium]|nr:T9SS type A sorting domain-containing protein [bacterium]
NVFPKQDLGAEGEFEVDLGDYVQGNHGKYAVMQDSQGALTYQTQNLFDGKIKFVSSNPSSLLLIEDSVVPELSVDQAVDLDALEQDLLVTILDYGVGLKHSALKLKINNQLQDSSFDDENTLRIKKSSLALDKLNNISIEAVDYLGNAKSMSLLVQAVGPIVFQESVVVPNPIRSSNAFLKVKLNRVATKLQLSLYDSASSRVYFQNLHQISKNSYLPLDDFNLESLANGVYFLKIQVEDSEGNINKKIVKLAIIK